MPVGIHLFAKLVKFFLSIEVSSQGTRAGSPRLSPGAPGRAGPAARVGGPGAAVQVGMRPRALGDRVKKLVLAIVQSAFPSQISFKI